LTGLERIGFEWVEVGAFSMDEARVEWSRNGEMECEGVDELVEK
jgi:hypothetical protein